VLIAGKLREERWKNDLLLFWKRLPMIGFDAPLKPEKARWSKSRWCNMRHIGIMAKRKSKQEQAAQRQMDKWADFMKRIIKNPEIADRIPNDANLLFTDGDVIFINGEPRRYSELVRVDEKMKTAKSKRQKQLAVSN
jgi:hypothetical protein